MTITINGHDYTIAEGWHRPSALLTKAGYRAEHFTLLVKYVTSVLEHIQDDHAIELGPECGIIHFYPVYLG